MFQKTPPTRSTNTEAYYLRVYRSRAKEFEKELKVSEITPNEVAAKLLVNYEAGQYAQRTWRVYKAAALYVLKTFHPECEEAIEQLSAASSAGLVKQSPKGSGTKAKALKDTTLEALARALEARADFHEHAKTVHDLVFASLLTGLRPHEWSHSTIGRHPETGRLILKVRNSKFSNGRANGEYREMFIDKLTEDERGHLQRSIRNFSGAQTDIAVERFLNCLRKEFNEAKKEACADPAQSRHTKAAIRSVSLYTFRHQFVADAKLSLTGTPDHAVVLAALLGHNSVETAPMHYGRRRNGGVFELKVIPTTESIEAVQRITARTYDTYLATRETPLSPLLRR